MADDTKRKLEIPWATLLPIVAALAGIVAQYKPLVSKRPETPSVKVVEQTADQDVDARLWQDPLAVVQKAKAQLDKAQLDKSLKPAATVAPCESHSLCALAAHIKKVAAGAENTVLLLPVMLDSGPYLEQAESRLRARQAVLEALSESDFIPVDGEHIGFVFEKQWLPVSPNPPTTTALTDTPLFFAWEECVRDDPAHAAVERKGAENDFERIFVLWLPAAEFNPYPLRNLAVLLKNLGEELPARVIGPANSNGLQALYREARTPQDPQLKAKYGPTLDRVKVFSARATASDEWLAGHPFDEKRSIEDEIDEAVSANWNDGNFEFRRTILSDDVVLGALVDELRLRRDIHVGAWEKEPKPWEKLKFWKKKPNEWRSGDHIVILSEWDSAYGRSLAKTFRDEADKAQSPDRPIDPDPTKRIGPQINSYRYMHGLDGRLPGDAVKDESNADSTKKQDSSASGSGEATEGSNQSDFLRRLAESLRQQETLWQNQGEEGIKAIGVLGSDIYDKLMVLRALRPIFPNATFFTNNYDAHFERLEDWDDVHNLIVASPFSGTLDPWQKALAPFRDNNQTSMYAGTLIALGKIEINKLSRFPHLFEIGRNGIQELRIPENPNSPETTPFRDWLHTPGRRTILSFAGAALILLVVTLLLSLTDRTKIGGGSAWERLKRGSSRTVVWLVFGVPAIVLAIAAFASSGTAALEPLAFLSGTSIWPSEMLRLIALLLAIHFLIKAHVDLKSNEAKLARRFILPTLAAEKWDWRSALMAFRRWLKEDSIALTAKDAWTPYLRCNQWRSRLFRVGFLVLIYSAFAVAIFFLFPFPAAPARGPTALNADLCILVPAVLGMIILTLYVVDAIRLTSNFIRVVTNGVSGWEPESSRAAERIPPLTREDLKRYYDITFVAERTEVIAPLIWYPLVVLAIMILARSAYFDNWTWPYSLLLVLCFNALWAFGAAALLRRAAEQLRTEALRKLRSLRIASYNSSERRQMFDELIEEIRSLKKGAFAPLSEQPFIRAIVLPSGGLGLLAVGQRLLEIF